MSNGYTHEINEEDLLYTLIKYLCEDESHRKIAILLTYATIEIRDTGEFSNRDWNRLLIDVYIQLPIKAFRWLKSLSKEKELEESDPFLNQLKSFVNPFWNIEKKLRNWIQELLPYSVGYDVGTVEFAPKGQRSYEGWREEVLSQLIGRGVSNQASFQSKRHPLCEYNGMRFRSKSEIALAKYFEESGVLFFPLPLANCRGEKKEPDYLVCKDGKWAILECVSDEFHPSIEKEANRTAWFQNHHIEVRQYTARQCYSKPKEVVDDFIRWLNSKR